MTRPKDLPPALQSWATGNYSAGPSWGGTPQRAAPGGSFLTPNLTLPAEVANYLHGNAFDVAQGALSLVGQIEALNFRTSVSQSFVHAAWNPGTNAWYGIETTTNCKASFTAGWTWGSNLITGADTLHRIESDPSGNMVITTNVASGALHEFNVGTSTWTRRTASIYGGGSVVSFLGKVCVAYDTVNARWWIGGLNLSGGMVQGTSTDRVTWGAGTSPTTTGFEANLEVAYGNGRLVLLGRVSGGGSNVWTSTNGGQSWTTQTPIAHAFTTGATDQIRYSAVEGLFMATFTNGSTACKVYTSPDGVTWTARATSVTKAITKIAPMGAMWVALQSQGSVLFSLDSGATWRHAGFQVDTPVWLSSNLGQLFAVCSSTVFPGLVAGAGGALAL